MADARRKSTVKDVPDAERHDDVAHTENKAVQILRVALAILLVAAAVATSMLVYRTSRDAEFDSFQKQFEAVATALLESFRSDVGEKLYGALSISSFVGGALEQTGRKPWQLDLPITRMLQGTAGARFASHSLLLSYSPMIFTEEARAEFEEYAAEFEEANGLFRAGFDFPCYICGGQEYTTGDPFAFMHIPGVASFTCVAADYLASNGVANYDNCPYFTQLAHDACSCQKIEDTSTVHTWSARQGMFSIEEGVAVPRTSEANDTFYSPIWQHATTDRPNGYPGMYDQMTDPDRAELLRNVRKTHRPIFSKTHMRDAAFYEVIGGTTNQPGFLFYFPVSILNERGNSAEVVGTISLEYLWSKFLTSVFPPYSENVDVVIEDSCGGNQTFKINKEHNALSYVGPGDIHDPSFTDMGRSTEFAEFQQVVNLVGYQPETVLDHEVEACYYRMSIYPQQAMEDQFLTSKPFVYASAVGGMFLATIIVFLLYDLFVRRRQRKIVERVTQTGEIVSSLFPKEFRDRVYEQASDDPSRRELESSDVLASSQPIADFFPECTVCFIDVANFTAWCSERGPEQVFRLLEDLYREFDIVARRFGVFKVETIGDSYVAACGLPKPRADHALVMTIFAEQCLIRMSVIVKELEARLGPDTGDLRARCGLHSGPVTAGVLRGDKARFQLFGGTMNRAARMEAMGSPHRIHASEAVVKALEEAGKGDWCQRRSEVVSLKGLGECQTFWINPPDADQLTIASEASSLIHSEAASVTEDLEMYNLAREKREHMKKNKRLVDWNVELLSRLLKKIVAARKVCPSHFSYNNIGTQNSKREEGTITIDELTEVIDLPNFNAQVAMVDDKDVQLPSSVQVQLRSYVRKVASMYRDVPFHNFEHASHVIMSAEKMMQRIIEPAGIDYQLDGVSESDKRVAIARQIHEATYGLSSDPMMQFSVVFSALIHDLDHTGLTNQELSELQDPLVQQYRNQSVAEQNSVDIAWSILQQDEFVDLRQCFFANASEQAYFRVLLVNAVMATDIADKTLQKQRRDRWSHAFSNDDAEIMFHSSPRGEGDNEDDEKWSVNNNRKASIVFEHIIQASDVSHTMQHWFTFRKFNERLFEERYVAWLKGVSGADDPSVGWYKGELGFFDFYLIPLAKKLDKCGVFGVSYHEYLYHAQENRQEWEQKGQEIVATMLAKYQKKYANGLPEEYNNT